MDSNIFNVIYTGQIIDGFDSDAVVAAFAKKFKLPVTKAELVIKAQKERVLKPRLEHVKAYKLKSALEAMGLEVRLERAAALETTPVVEAASPSESVEANSDLSTASLTGHDQAVDQAKQESQSYDATNSAAWSLEPLVNEEESEADKEEAIEKPTERVLFTTKVEHVYQPEAKANAEAEAEVKSEVEDVKPEATGRSVTDLIKVVGGWVVGIFAVALLLLKKFGLFKFLKIGGLMTAAAFAGYEAEEICMGNDECESAIDNQVDDCWEQSGLDGYDWDNMSDEEYFKLKPKVEAQFIACFVYEDTQERVLVSPIDLRFDLIDSCFLTEHDSCLQLAETQFKSCYNNYGIKHVVSAATVDFYQAVIDNQSDFKGYYSCFIDDSGAPLFAEILENWDDIFESY